MPAPVNPSVLTWTVPQTNADGTNLVDLKEHRVEIGTSVNGPWTQVAVVPATQPDPPIGATASSPVSSWGALPPGNYHARVLAVDIAGNKGAASIPSPFDVVDTVAPGVPTNLSFA